MNEKQLNDAIKTLEDFTKGYPLRSPSKSLDTVLAYVRDMREMMDAVEVIEFRNRNAWLERFNYKWQAYSETDERLGLFDSPLEAFAAIKLADK